MQPAVLVERHGHTTVITINRPEARNASSSAVSSGVGGALEAAEHDRDVRVVVLTGAGDQAFCAGADLKEVAAGGNTLGDHPEWGFAGYVAHPISKPTIAAVNGLALGGGTELVLASDLAVAVRSARFGLPEVKRGLLAAAGGAFRLPQQLPRKIAMEVLLTGEPITAEEALRWGLVNRVVDDGEALGAALALADVVAANAPLSVQASKRVAHGIVDGRMPADDDGWARTRTETSRMAGSEDSREGVRAFAEKRAPVWLGR